MESKTVIVRGVAFRFTMGAIHIWMELTGNDNIFDYCKAVIGADAKSPLGITKSMGEVLLASYKAGEFTQDQPVKLNSVAQLWDWMDDVPTEEKEPLFELMFKSIKRRIDDYAATVQGVTEDADEKKN